jgi:hypothetical protein
MILQNLKHLRSAWLALFGLTLTLACAAQQNPEPRLFLIHEGKRYGYIDESGTIVLKLPAQVDLAYPFAEGLAAIRIDGKRAFINTEGKIVIPPQFTETGDFREGLAWARIEDKEGMINQRGEFVIREPPYRIVSDFVEGLAIVNMRDGYGYIDKTGKVVIAPRFETATAFIDGLAMVEVLRKDGSGRWGWIDKRGRYVILPKYEFIAPFSEGLAFVMTGNWTGCINKSGKVVLRRSFDNSKGDWPAFSEGLAPLRVNGKSFFIDKTGRKVLRTPYFQVGNFSEGLAWFIADNDKHGFIDKTGKVVIAPQFDFAIDFENGLAKIRLQGKEGYINKSGKIVWMESNTLQ